LERWDEDVPLLWRSANECRHLISQELGNPSDVTPEFSLPRDVNWRANVDRVISPGPRIRHARQENRSSSQGNRRGTCRKFGVLAEEGDLNAISNKVSIAQETHHTAVSQGSEQFLSRICVQWLNDEANGFTFFYEP